MNNSETNVAQPPQENCISDRAHRWKNRSVRSSRSIAAGRFGLRTRAALSLWRSGSDFGLWISAAIATIIYAVLLAAGSALAAANAPAGMENLDLDHDGRISLQEFYPTGPPPLHPRMKQVFESFDKDHRGSLTFEDTRKVIATVSGLLPKLGPEVCGALGSIPLEVSPKSKRALVKVSINGVEGRFLVDTGTSDTIVDAEFARKAGVDFVEICTHIVSGNYGKKGDIISFVRVADLEIAGTHFRDFHAVLKDESEPRRDFTNRFDGILGANLLFAKPLTLDYRRQRLSFPTNTSGPHDFAFPLASGHGKTAALDADIDGVKVFLMLDSGAAIGDTLLINERYHAALRKLAGDPTAGQYHAKEVRVAGKLLLANQGCLLRPFEEAVIGALFFDRHLITVDTSAGKVWFDRNPLTVSMLTETSQAP